MTDFSIDHAAPRPCLDDSYRTIALDLSCTVEGLIHGLPGLLEAGDLKDEEGLIEKAFGVLDTTAFRLAQLDLEAEAEGAAK